MKKIVSYEKEIVFKTNIGEITSISLERELSINNLLVSGVFNISGEYKITTASTTVESFEYKLPFEINIDEKYDTKQATVDIDDFYYEVINDNILKVSIDLKIDKLKEPELNKKEINLDREDEEIMEINEEPEGIISDIPNKINSLFSNVNDTDNYISYNIYIVREGDDLSSILDKYQISEEDLKKYNDLSSLEIGNKIVIPSK